jgi:acyl carrier protein
MVTLVVALEKKFGIKVRATDLTLENFDNPVRIAEFLERL